MRKKKIVTNELNETNKTNSDKGWFEGFKRGYNSAIEKVCDYIMSHPINEDKELYIKQLKKEV